MSICKNCNAEIAGWNCETRTVCSSCITEAVRKVNEEDRAIDNTKNIVYSVNTMNIVEEVKQEIEDKEQEEIKRKVKAFVKDRLERVKQIESNIESLENSIESFEKELSEVEDSLIKVEDGDFEEALKGIPGQRVATASMTFTYGTSNNPFTLTGTNFTTAGKINLT